MADFFIIRDTAANFAFNNPTLLLNQIAVETDVRNGVEYDTGKAKLGDDVHTYAQLPYWNPSGAIFITAVPYDLAAYYAGAPTASVVILQFVANRAYEMGTAHRGYAAIAATAQTDFVLAVNGVAKATLRFAAAAQTITVIGAGAAIAAGDIVTVTAPASPDATLADVSFTIAGHCV